MAKDWHPEDVKAAIRKTGTTLSAFASQNGLGVSTVKMTLRRRSPRVQELIASHLGTSPQKIWPTRYDESGRPVDLRRRDARSSNRPR